MIVQYFYGGLTPSERNSLETMNGKEFFNLTGDEAYMTLDEIVERAQQWDFQNSWDRQDPATKTRVLYEVKDDANIREDFKVLKCQFDTLVLNKPMNATDTYQADVYGLCTSPMHFAQNCLTLSTEYLIEEVNAFNEYKKPTSGPFSKTYNPGWWNHPNFSWKQNQPLNQGGNSTQAQNQYWPSYQAQPSAYQVPQPAPQSSLKDTLKAFMHSSSKDMKELKRFNSQTMEELKNVTMANNRDIQELKS